MENLKALLLTFVLIVLVVTGVLQFQIIENQKVQMKQQFHSDGIALVALFGEEGLNKLKTAKTPDELSVKESFATGLLIQRFIVAYQLKNAFDQEYWQKAIMADGKVTFRSPLLRARWETLRRWYPQDIQDFIDSLIAEK